MEHYSTLKKNEIMPFKETDEPKDYHTKWRQIPYDSTYTQNPEYDTNDPIYETETDSHILRLDLWLPWGSRVEKGWIGSLRLEDVNYT